MQRRIETLKRLAALYGVVEEARSAALQRAVLELREAEDARDVQHSLRRTARVDGRAALNHGDRMGSLLAETCAGLAAWKSEHLGEICLERAEVNAEAHTQYLASRVQSDQMKRLRDNLQVDMKRAEERRTQGASDDRFLSRKRWRDQKAK